MLLAEDVLFLIIRGRQRRIRKINNKVAVVVLTYKLRRVIIEYNQLVFKRAKTAGTLSTQVLEAIKPKKQ